MKQNQPSIFEKTATFYKPDDLKPQDNKQSRYIKSNARMFDFQLKVQGRKIVQKSQPSTSDSNIQQNKTSSTIQNEQFTPPQKKLNIPRKGSVIQIRSDDKIIREVRCVQSSNLYTKASYEFPQRKIEYKDISFGDHNANQIMNDEPQKRSIRILSKQLPEEIPKPSKTQPTECSKKLPIKLIPTQKQSPTIEQLKNKLPDIFQSDQKMFQAQREPNFAKRATSAGFGIQNKEQQKVPENEFLDLDLIPQFQTRHNLEMQLTTQPSHLFSLFNKHPSVLLPSLDNGTKSRPFLQRKAQAKILDRIFSGK